MASLLFSCVAPSSDQCTIVSTSRHACWNPVVMMLHTSFNPAMTPAMEVASGWSLVWVAEDVVGITETSLSGTWPSPDAAVAEVSGILGPGD